MFKQCALCACSSDLQKSHIIPGFVFDWLRETSATGHIRFSQSPNQRVQDGWKPRMLCGGCEQLFSTWEKKFSEECFVPFNSGNVRNVTYGPWMLKFATSVSWRILQVFAASGYCSEFPAHIVNQINDTLQEWADFLMGKKPNPGRHEQHILLMGEIESASISNMPCNINRYLSRAIDPDVVHDQESAMSYAKMGRFILFGFITMKNPRHWKGTKLHVQRGRFGQPDIELPSTVWDLISERARLTAEKYSQISERQQTKILESYQQDPDRVSQSDTLRAMHQDVWMFGKSAFEATQPTIQDGVKKK